MMPTVTIAPVRKTLHVHLPREKAFDLFTRGVDRWWPRTHHPAASPMKAAIIEPFAGGRWYHSCEDGSEIDFGHVLLWQPPERLILAWENNCNWRYDPEAATEVEVNFIAESATSTRVELEHRHLERLGDKAEEFFKRVDGGWGVVLECFIKTADATTA
ncbi:MAG: SRPBCC family protein [Methylovirgula sp.]